MERQLPYELSYKTLKLWRTVENCSLWAVFIISTILQVLGIAFIKELLDISLLVEILNILNFVSIISYGILYAIVEIIMQPIAASGRRKGFIDNSLGTRLLNMPVIGYYDNDSIKDGAYKMLVNCYENCFFTYNIVKTMLLGMVCKNLVLFIILLLFAYYGVKENVVAIPILQLFLSSLFLIELVYHLTFFFKLRNLCEQFRHIFSNKQNKEKTLANAFYMILEYETTLAYNKSPNSDSVYKKLNSRLTSEWNELKVRYNIS